MAEWNFISIQGHLGRAPSFRATAAGNNLTTFTMSVWQGNNKPTMWLLVKTMIVVPELGKGDKVKVTGKLIFEQWKKPDGSDASVFAVWADTVEVLKKKEDVPMPTPEVVADDDAPF